MGDTFSATLPPISETHFCAIACELAQHIWTATRAVSGDQRPWNDLAPTDRARRVEQASWLLRLHRVSKEQLA